MNDDLNKETSLVDKFLMLLAIVFIFIGGIILVYFLVSLSASFSIIGGGLVKMDATGQTGDFIGGVVGSLWAFSGVLLFYYAFTASTKRIKDSEERIQSSNRPVRIAKGRVNGNKKGIRTTEE